MCYVVFLSTSSPEDLSHSSKPPLLRFEPIGDASEEAVRLLEHRHQWYIGSASGCSCTFRHASPDLGFGVPEEWYPEGDDHIHATQAFIAVVRRLVEAGHEVDCVDVWSGDPASRVRAMKVHLDKVADNHFRFFEGYRFVFLQGRG